VYQQSPEHQLINRLNNACVKFDLCIYIITSFKIYTLHKMQHLALILYREYPQTCVLKIIVYASFGCSIRVYQSICTLRSEYSSMSTSPLIKICKILELEPHLLNRTFAVTLYDCNLFLC